MLTMEQRDHWAAALRSGEYQQCRGGMERNGGMCCLNVLCKTAGYDGWSYVFTETLLGGETSALFEKYNDRDELTFPEIAVLVDELPVLSDAGQQ